MDIQTKKIQKKAFLGIFCLCFMLLFPTLAHAEIFYLLPRLGLNISMMQDRRIVHGSNVINITDTTNATFALSLAAGIHFSRAPLRLELDLTFRTSSPTIVEDYEGNIKADTYQLTTMANVYYDIYIPNMQLVPYVGVGVGFTAFFSNTKAGFNTNSPSPVWYSSDALANADFSWNVIVGLSYPVASFLLDFSARFVDSGKPKLVASPLSSKARIMGFDFLLGFRFPL